jgi:hypothetical protein
MPFDAKSFAKAKFEPRTAELRIPELQEWFGDDDPVFVVRGLSGIELAQAMEASSTAKQRADLAEALMDGAMEDKSEAIKDAFGLGAGVPDELIRYHELIIRGTVEPTLTRDVSVKLAERFPVDHKSLAITILNLTGRGYAVKKKPQDSGETPTPE